MTVSECLKLSPKFGDLSMSQYCLGVVVNLLHACCDFVSICCKLLPCCPWFVTIISLQLPCCPQTYLCLSPLSPYCCKVVPKVISACLPNLLLVAFLSPEVQSHIIACQLPYCCNIVAIQSPLSPSVPICLLFLKEIEPRQSSRTLSPLLHTVSINLVACVTVATLPGLRWTAMDGDNFGFFKIVAKLWRVNYD